MKKNAFQIIDASGHKHEIPADSLRELKDVPAEQIIDMLCSGEMWFKVTELYKSRGETEYALRSSFRLRGGRPIPPNKLGDYQVTAPASTRFNARLPKLIEIDPADVRCEHDDVRVDFLGSSFQIYTPSGKVYIVPKSEVSVLDRFSSKELERLLKDRFYILTVKATYDGTEIKYTINARFSPPSAPGGISSRASFRSARMAGRSASYASMAAESKEEPASSSVTARSTYARHPKVFLTSSEWDGLIEELRVGEAKFQVAQDEYIKVSSRAAGEFYIQVADLKWMQVTREQGLSHIDFEIASLIPFAGKPVVSISKAALARLAARKAAAEARTTLTSVAARAAAASETPVVWESWARLGIGYIPGMLLIVQCQKVLAGQLGLMGLAEVLVLAS